MYTTCNSIVNQIDLCCVEESASNFAGDSRNAKRPLTFFTRLAIAISWNFK